MSAMHRRSLNEKAPDRRNASVQTSLYDLVKAIHEELNLTEDKLVIEVIMHLIRSGHIRFTGNLRNLNRVLEAVP